MDAPQRFDTVELQPATNPDDDLNAALRTRNREQFQRALELGADPDRKSDDGVVTGDGNGGRLSVFELCCQRAKHAGFIEDCLRARCQVNKVNEFLDAAPINLAIESEDADNIAALLANANVHIDRKRDGQTPLSQLCAGLIDTNFDRRLAAIRLLVHHQANVNITDERGQPPILVLLKSRKLNAAGKRLAVELLLDTGVVDVDTHFQGQARKLLQRDYSDLRLPAELTDAERSCTDAALLDALRSLDEERFVRGVNARMLASDGGAGLGDFVRAATASGENGTNPMQRAIVNGLARCVEKLLRCGAEVGLNDSGFDAILNACAFGYHRIVGLLLSAAPVGPALIATASYALLSTLLYTLPSDIIDCQRCFDLLMTVPGIELDRTDPLGNTALHLAVQHKHRAAIRSLLRRGASMGAQNWLGTVAIEDIDADMLAEHLDECLTEVQPQQLRSGENESELCVMVRFSNLRGRKYGAAAGTAAQYGGNEMTAIAHIVQTRELQHLVKHPVVESFLHLKWCQLAPAFFVNFACFAVYCVALVAYILCLNGHVASPAVRMGLVWVVKFGMFYMVMRELLKLEGYWRRVGILVRIVRSLWAIALIVLPGALLAKDWSSDGWMTEQTRRTVSAITILLAVGEFFVLLAMFPVMSFSTHFVMLLTVVRSFLKSLMLYSILLVAFALCFCMLLGKDASSEKKNNDVDDDEDQFNKFVSPGLAIVKTVVMLTGEFDAGSINFVNNGFSYFVFVIFVLLVSTVLFNLLNGLAVNDTQAIKADAELTYLIYRAKLLAQNEPIVDQRYAHAPFNGLNLIPEFLPQAAIKVLPLDNNRVLIPGAISAAAMADHEAQQSGDTDAAQELSILQLYGIRGMHWACCIGLDRSASMEPRIVKSMRAVLEQRKRGAAERAAADERDAATERRFAGIVTRLDKVLKGLNAAEEMD